MLGGSVKEHHSIYLYRLVIGMLIIIKLPYYKEWFIIQQVAK